MKDLSLKELPEGVRFNKDYHGVKRASLTIDGYYHSLYYCPNCELWNSGLVESRVIKIKNRKTSLALCRVCGKSIAGTRHNPEFTDGRWDERWGHERE